MPGAASNAVAMGRMHTDPGERKAAIAGTIITTIIVTTASMAA